MALDKIVDSTQLDSDLTSVANAIRTKGGTSAQLAFPAGFVSAVQAIPTGGITPSGSITITQNGTFDVSSVASAIVNVEQIHTAVVTVSADKNSGTQYWLQSNSFVSSNYTDDNFFVAVLKIGATTAAQYVTTTLYAGNRPVAYAGATAQYRYKLYCSSATAANVQYVNKNVSGQGDGYNTHLNIKSNGNVYSSCSTSGIIQAGTYLVMYGLLPAS